MKIVYFEIGVDIRLCMSWRGMTRELDCRSNASIASRVVWHKSFHFFELTHTRLAVRLCLNTNNLEFEEHLRASCDGISFSLGGMRRGMKVQRWRYLRATTGRRCEWISRNGRVNRMWKSRFRSSHLSREYILLKKCKRAAKWVEISYIYRDQMSQVSCVVLVGQTCHTLNTHSKVGYIVGEWIQRENQYLLRRSLCVISHQHDSLNSSIATSHYLSRRLSSSVSSVDEHIFCCKYLFWYYSSAERESAENWVRNKPWPRDDLTLLN